MLRDKPEQEVIRSQVFVRYVPLESSYGIYLC